MGVDESRSERTLAVLHEFSYQTGVDLDLMLSLYIVLGEDILFMLHLLQGYTVQFPKLRKLHGCLDSSCHVLVRPDEDVVLDNGSSVDARSVVSGMVIRRGKSLLLVDDTLFSSLGFGLLILRPVEG